VFTETIALKDAVTPTAEKARDALGRFIKASDAANASLVASSSAGKIGSTTMGTLGSKTFDAANAMKVGKETISAALGGIKAAFTSLAAGDVKGAIAGVTDSIASMAKLLDLAVPGLGQAVAAVIQIAGGLVGITAGLIKSGVEFAISSSEAKQQMLGLFQAMGGGIVTGEQTEAMIDGLKDKFGIAKDSMIGWTNALHAMGVTDLATIEKSLLATASAQALVTKGGAEAFQDLTKKIQTFVQTGQGLKLPLKGLGSLASMGLTVADVASKMGVSAEALAGQLKAGTADAAKFGDAMQTALIEKGKGPLEKFAASSKNISKLLSESFGDMFEDIDVGPFMAEVKSLFDIFSQGKESGKTMKAGIGGFFKEVFATLTKVVPMVKHFLLDMVIYGLKAYIAVKPIVQAIKDFATSATGASIISTVLSSVWEVLKVIGVTIAVVVVAVMALWAAMIIVSTAVWTAVGAFLGLVAEAGGALTGWIASAATAAYDFVAGLVGGIAAGASQVIGAVKGLASSATGAFKSALGIASPSKVMAGLGGHTGAGFAEGLEDTGPDVHAAASGVAGAAVEGASSGGGAPAGGASLGGANINVTVMIDGAGKSAMEITEEMVASVFERMAIGAGV
jgi:phage-related protein